MGYRDGIRPDDHRREEILRELAEFFPSGASPKRLERYIEQIRKHRFRIRHVEEGIQRLIAIREQQTFPPIAQVLRYCHEARADDMKREFGSAQDFDQQTRRDTSEKGVARDIHEFRALRVELGPRSEDADGNLVPDYQPPKGKLIPLFEVLDRIDF